MIVTLSLLLTLVVLLIAYFGLQSIFYLRNFKWLWRLCGLTFLILIISIINQIYAK